MGFDNNTALALLVTVVNRVNKGLFLLNSHTKTKYKCILDWFLRGWLQLKARLILAHLWCEMLILEIKDFYYAKSHKFIQIHSFFDNVGNLFLTMILKCWKKNKADYHFFYCFNFCFFAVYLQKTWWKRSTRRFSTVW